MQCPRCEFEAPKKDFRWLYRPGIASPTAYRMCPKCGLYIEVDELVEEKKEKKAAK